jgi:hypothetical protein
VEKGRLRPTVKKNEETQKKTDKKDRKTEIAGGTEEGALGRGGTRT